MQLNRPLNHHVGSKLGIVVQNNEFFQLQIQLDRGLLLAHTDIRDAYFGVGAADLQSVLVGHLYDREVLSRGHAENLKDQVVAFLWLLKVENRIELPLILYHIRVERTADLAL